MHIISKYVYIYDSTSLFTFISLFFFITHHTYMSMYVYNLPLNFSFSFHFCFIFFFSIIASENVLTFGLILNQPHSPVSFFFLFFFSPSFKFSSRLWESSLTVVRVSEFCLENIDILFPTVLSYSFPLWRRIYVTVFMSVCLCVDFFFTYQI